MRSFTSSRPWWSASRISRAPGDVGGVLRADVPRQLEHGVQPGADPAGLGALVARALQLADLAQRGLADLLGQVGRLDAGAVVVGALGLVLAELLADGGELLAEQELALALVHALADVVLDLLGDVELGEVLARPLEHPRQARLDVGGLEELALLLVGEVRRVAGHVGQLRGVGDPLDGVDDLPGVAPLQDRDDDALVLLGELADVVGDGSLVDGLGLDPQRRAGAGHAGADADALTGAQHGGAGAAGKSADLLDGGDRRRASGSGRRGAGRAAGGSSEPAWAASMTGAGVAVELDGHDHAGQHDQVGNGQQRKGDDVGHGSSILESEGLNFDSRSSVPGGASAEGERRHRRLGTCVPTWGVGAVLSDKTPPTGGETT